MDSDVEMQDVTSPHCSGYQGDESNLKCIEDTSKRMQDHNCSNKHLMEEEKLFLNKQLNDTIPRNNSNLVIRSTQKSLRYIQDCESKDIDPYEDDESHEVSERQKREVEQCVEKAKEFNTIITFLILRLSNFTSTYVGEEFYDEQYNTVMDMLRRAFVMNENQSMLLLSRTNKMMNKFICKIKNDLVEELSTDSHKWNIKVIRINSILTLKETAILNHFAECLGMDNADKQVLAHEMKERMQEYFKCHPEVSILFIFENVEYYIENTKQSLLYKILDMFQYTKIKFAFISTSQKIDILDSFEKRIKSRFSHRQVLFYDEELTTFYKWIRKTINNLTDDYDITLDGQAYIKQLERFIFKEDSRCMTIFENLFDKGKDYEFLCTTLKIALSHLNSFYRKQPLKIKCFETEGYDRFWKSLDYVKNLSSSNNFTTVLSSTPEAYFAVLISGKNAFTNCKLDYFTFSLAYKEYKLYTKRETNIQKISKETFVKIFIDLISKGFFKSKALSDFTSVNNKVVLGMDENSLSNMIKDNLKHLKLSTSIERFSENRAA